MPEGGEPYISLCKYNMFISMISSHVSLQSISVYQHCIYEFNSLSWSGVFVTALCDNSDLWQVSGFL